LSHWLSEFCPKEVAMLKAATIVTKRILIL